MTNDPNSTYPPSFWAAPRPQDRGRDYYNKQLVPYFLKHGRWPGKSATQEGAKTFWSTKLADMSDAYTVHEFYQDMKRWEVDRKWVWRTRLQRPLTQWFMPHFRRYHHFPGRLPLEIWAKILNKTKHKLDRHDFSEEIYQWVQERLKMR